MSTSIAKAEMLIRKNVSDVFNAFVDPAMTVNFWFTKSSGRLEEDSTVTWTWEMFDHSTLVIVKALEENKRILIEWGDKNSSTTVEWNFIERPNNTTLVTIINRGFRGTEREVFQQVIEATEGFVLVLCGLKAFLEHGLRLQLIEDRFPDLVRK